MHDIAPLFPAVRPQDREIEEHADRVATEVFAGSGRIPQAAIEAGVELLPADERSRIVASWTRDHQEAWSSICRAMSDVALAERTLVASAVLGAITDREPPPEIVLRALEAGALQRSPVAALALAIPPASVWERSIVHQAIRIAEGPDDPGAFLDDVTAYAHDSLTDCHRARVLCQSERVEGALPLAAFARASRTLGTGCRLVRVGGAARDELAALLLVAYARLLEPTPTDYITSTN